MAEQTSFQRILGVSIPGLLITIIIWSIGIAIDAVTPIPEMKIVPWVSWTLIAMFVTDILYLLFGSLKQLKKSDWGKRLATKGPYQFVRHPLYSGVIYSATGLIATLQTSWSLLISVLPLSVFWSWLVQKEERDMVNRFGKKYLDYMEKTGQFFPSMKGLEDVAGSKKQ